MGLTERHWFENEDVPENYEWALEDAVYNSYTNKKTDSVYANGYNSYCNAGRNISKEGYLMENNTFEKLKADVKKSILDWFSIGSPNMWNLIHNNIYSFDVYPLDDRWVTYEYDYGFPIVYTAGNGKKRAHFVIPIMHTNYAEEVLDEVATDITNILIKTRPIYESRKASQYACRTSIAEII